jgi:hypothetical protein
MLQNFPPHFPAKLERFLTALDLNHAAASTQNQATNAILFSCEQATEYNWQTLHPCGATPPTQLRRAVNAWCRRKGTASAVGGKSTRGKTSWRKGRSSRRNLRKARHTLQLKPIMRAVELAHGKLRPYREKELAEARALAEESRADLAALEPRIREYIRICPQYLIGLKSVGFSRPTPNG